LGYLRIDINSTSKVKPPGEKQRNRLREFRAKSTGFLGGLKCNGIIIVGTLFEASKT